MFAFIIKRIHIYLLSPNYKYLNIKTIKSTSLPNYVLVHLKVRYFWFLHQHEFCYRGGVSDKCEGDQCTLHSGAPC